MRNGLKGILFIITLFVSGTVFGQDLLASQAPIDSKLRFIDSVAIHRLQLGDKAEHPAAGLYGNWGERYTAGATQLPDSFRISLRNFSMPTTSHIITSDFGLRRGRQHKGVDIKVYTGDTIRAAFSGKVRIVRYDKDGYGNYVVIRHHNGLETIYAHMLKNLVTEDQTVKAGTPIGLGGSTGRSNDSHLHFETRFCGIALNPTLLFDFRNQDVTGDDYLFCREKGKMVAQTQQTASTERATRYHKVVKGETLSTIARKHRTTVNELCRLNRISKTSTLRLGQILKYNN